MSNRKRGKFSLKDPIVETGIVDKPDEDKKNIEESIPIPNTEIIYQNQASQTKNIDQPNASFENSNPKEELIHYKYDQIYDDDEDAILNDLGNDLSEIFKSELGNHSFRIENEDLRNMIPLILLLKTLSKNTKEYQQIHKMIFSKIKRGLIKHKHPNSQ